MTFAKFLKTKWRRKSIFQIWTHRTREVRILQLSINSSGGQISTKHLTTSIKPFFATCRLPQYPEFAKNLRSFDGFDQMSAFWSMFWFKSFRNFLRKIAIFRTFDHWSEILYWSAGRPIIQDVCPPLICRRSKHSSCLYKQSHGLYKQSHGLYNLSNGLYNHSHGL